MSLRYVSPKACKSKHDRLPMSSQSQRGQIKFGHLAFWRRVVSRRRRRALRNARRTGGRRADVSGIYVNRVYSFGGSPLSWFDPDRPSALYDKF